MKNGYFIASAWNNGSQDKTGAVYGLKISIKNCERFFDKSWKCVTLHLMADGKHREIVVNVDKKSFWNNRCRELISKDIGRWLIEHGLAPWCKGSPPKFKLIPREMAQFNVEVLEQ